MVRTVVVRYPEALVATNGRCALPATSFRRGAGWMDDHSRGHDLDSFQFVTNDAFDLSARLQEFWQVTVRCGIHPWSLSPDDGRSRRAASGRGRSSPADHQVSTNA